MFAGREQAYPQGQKVHAIGSLGDNALLSWPSAETWQINGKPWTTRERIANDGPEDSHVCGLWRVSTSAGGAIRRIPVLAALSDQRLIGTEPLPANASRSLTGAPLWAVLEVDNTAGTREYLVDWGQTIEVNASSIVVGWVSPPGFVDLQRQPFPEFSGEDLVIVEHLMFCQLSRIESPSSQRGPLTLTQSFVVEATASGAFPVPRGAYAVQISRDNVGATLTTFCQQAIGAPALSVSRNNAAIRIENGQSVIQGIAPGVTHILPPVLAAESVLWTCQWLIAI